MTPLDDLHARLDTGGESALRAYYVQLAATELFVPLDGANNPAAIELDGSPVVLAFDTEDRLATFMEGGGERAVLSGRILIGLARDWKAGVGVNLGVAESAYIVPLEAIKWMQAALEAPVADMVSVGRFTAPRLPETALPAIDRALAALGGQAEAAYLVNQQDGEALLLIAGAVAGRQDAIAAHLGGAMAVQFPDHPVAVSFVDDVEVLRRAARIGLTFEIPQPQSRAIQMPGGDPDKPPKLR